MKLLFEMKFSSNKVIYMLLLVISACTSNTSIHEIVNHEKEIERLSKQILSDPKNLPETEIYTKQTLSKLAGSITDTLVMVIMDSDPLAASFIGRNIFIQRGTNIYYEALGSEILAIDFFNNWEIDSCLHYLRYSESAYKLLDDSLGLGRVTFLLGACMEQKQNLSDAYVTLLKSFEYYKAAGDSNKMVENSVELAFVLNRSNQLEKGLEILYRAKKYADSHPDYSGKLAIYNLLAETFYFQHKLSEAKKHALKALELATNIGSDQNIAFINNQLGLILSEEGSFEKSTWHFRETCRLKENGNNNDVSLAYYNMGKAYFMWGKIDSAKIILQKSLDLSKENENMLVCQKLANKLLTEIYKQEGDYRKAFSAFEAYQLFDDSLEKIQNKEAILRQQLEFENAERLSQLAVAEKEKNYEWKINRILISLGFVVTSALLIIIIRIRKSAKKKNEDSKAKLNLAMRELETNRKMLADFRAQLIDRNIEVLRSIPERKENDLDETEKQSKEEISDTLSGMENLRLLTHEDWRRFLTLLDEGYPGLRRKITEKYPNLTPAEERVFLLISIKTENKEISAILGISPDSVRKAKHRLKQKLQLPPDVVLESFIQEVTK